MGAPRGGIVTPAFMRPQVQLFTVDPKAAGLAPSIRVCVCCNLPARPDARWVGTICTGCRAELRLRFAAIDRMTPKVSA